MMNCSVPKNKEAVEQQHRLLDRLDECAVESLGRNEFKRRHRVVRVVDLTEALGLDGEVLRYSVERAG